ncbi:MAG: Spy/CpxP family protein refolding chaperone [Bdellovibrionaceae bacterium]|nr:Spy/CpxP family protein refolding chaperone [Pseudobdellovibrionaceae bacterium]
MFGRGFKKRRMVGVAIALIGMGALSACHSRTPEARIDHVASKVASKLDFTAEQKILLDDIAAEIKKDFQSEKEVRLSMRNEFKTWITSSELDKAKVKETIKSKMDRMEGRVDKYLDKVAALHKTLNAEQKEELIGFLDKFGPKD